MLPKLTYYNYSKTLLIGLLMCSSILGASPASPPNDEQGCITFILDMCGMSLSDDAYFAADFQGWDPEPMCDVGGNWEISFCGIDAGSYQYKFLDGPGGWEFQFSGDVCTNSADNNNRFVDITGGCDIEGPWCFEQCVMGSGSGSGDSSPPSFDGNVPDDITISCDDELEEGEALPIEDDCSIGCYSDEPVDDFSNLDECGLGIIYRTWTLADCAGNEGDPHIQEITVIDIEAPQFDERVDDITLDCGETIPEAVPLLVIDNCDEELEFSMMPEDDLSDLVDGLGEILRTWVVMDCSGNINEISQSIFVQGAANPTIEHSPLCEGESIFLTTGAYESYQWAFIDSNNDVIDLNTNNDSLLISQPGVYQLTVMSAGCEATVLDTIETVIGAMISTSDAMVCNAGEELDRSIDLLTLVDYDQVLDSIVICDASNSIINETLIDFEGALAGEIKYYIKAYRDSLCPPQLDSLMIQINECDCPQILDVGEICVTESIDSILLNDFNPSALDGFWVVDMPSADLYISGNHLVYTENVSGAVQLEYIYDDSNILMNCLNQSPQPNIASVDFINSNPPTLVSSNIVVCNSDTGMDLPFQIDLDTILTSANTGVWMSNDGLVIDADNIVSFQGEAISNVSFIFTQDDALNPCNNESITLNVSIIDCACPPIAVTSDTLVCNAGGVIDLNSFVLAGAGFWSYSGNGPDMNATISGTSFDVTDLLPGNYIFDYTLDPLPGGQCPSVASTLIQIEAYEVLDLTVNDTVLCNGMNNQGRPFTLNLNDLLANPSQNVEWSTSETLFTIDSNGSIDFTSVDPGIYAIEALVSLDANAVCNADSETIMVEVVSCDCPLLPSLSTTSFCNDSGVIDLSNQDPSVGIGDWVLFDPNGMPVSFIGSEIDLQNLSAGQYTLEYRILSSELPQGCQDDFISFSLDIFEVQTLDLPEFIEACNVAQSSLAESVINFEEISAAYQGNWITPLDFPSSINDYSAVSFEGFNSEVYTFTFSSPSPDGLCPNSIFEMQVFILDCSCPDISLLTPPPLCNNNGAFDLNALIIAQDLEGTFEVQDPNGQDIPTDNNMIVVNDFIGGDYRVTFTPFDLPQDPCEMTSTSVITIEEAFNPGSPVNTSFCFEDDRVLDLAEFVEGEDEGGTWSIVNGNNVGFDLQNNTVELAIVDSGNYILEYSGTPLGIACGAESIQIEFEVFPELIADAGQDQILTCENTLVTLGTQVNPDNDLIYEWYNESGDLLSQGSNSLLEVGETGIYSLIVQNIISGCEVEDQVTVSDDGTLPDFELMITQPECGGSDLASIIVSSINGGFSTYDLELSGDTSWIQMSISEGYTFNLSPGNYDIIVSSGQCISPEQTIMVNNPDEESLSIDFQELVFQNTGEYIIDLSSLVFVSGAPINEIQVIDSNQNLLCNGSFEDCSELFMDLQSSTILSITATTLEGCSASIDINLRLEIEENLYIPNILNLNSFDENEELKIFSDGIVTELQTYAIYDRWGNLIYEDFDGKSLVDPNEDWWDGRFNGTPVNPGVYILKMTYLSPLNNDSPVEITSSITLLR